MDSYREERIVDGDTNIEDSHAHTYSFTVDGQHRVRTGYLIDEDVDVTYDGEVGTVSVSQNGGNVEIIVTPNLLVKPITVRYYRTGLKA